MRTGTAAAAVTVLTITALCTAGRAQEVTPRVAELTRDLGSKEAPTRAAAAKALGALGTESASAVPRLVRLLGDFTEVFEVIASREELSDLRGVQFTPDGLGRNTTVSTVVCTALGQIGDRRASEPLCRLMLSESTGRADAVGTPERAAATKALGELGDGRAVPSLLKAMFDRDYDVSVCDAAAESLAKVGEPSVAPLVKVATAGRGGHPAQAVRVLGQVGKPAVPALVELFERNDGSSARAVAEALAQTQEPDAAKALVVALRSRNTGRAEAGVSGLASLVRALNRAPESDDTSDPQRQAHEEQMRLVIRALQEGAVEPLVAILGDFRRPFGLRGQAARLLGFSRDARVVKPLAAARTDSNTEVQSSASLALRDLRYWAGEAGDWFTHVDEVERQRWAKSKEELAVALLDVPE